MSDAFERGWSLVKMARYHIGPTTMFDILEARNAEAGQEGDELKEKFPKNVYGPAGILHGSTDSGDVHIKTMMTPNEYRRLAGNTPRRFLGSDDYLSAIAEQMKLGRPYAMPYLFIRPKNKGNSSDGYEGDWNVSGHEGRHRMQSLIDMGYGDEQIPIILAMNYGSAGPPWPTHGETRYGGSKETRDRLNNKRLYMQDLGERILDKDGNEVDRFYDENVNVPLRLPEKQNWSRGEERIV